MATLNTLRTRGGVIVSIVIGIALLAFLLGDLSSAGNMMNARKMRVGEIDGNKIGYLEYTEQVDYLTGIQQTMTGKDALSSEEQMQVQNFAWDNLLNKYVLAPRIRGCGYSRVGERAGRHGRRQLHFAGDHGHIRQSQYGGLRSRDAAQFRFEHGSGSYR